MRHCIALVFTTHSRLETMRDFAWMLRRREDDLLNYFEAPIDNGIVEGLNNKAKVIIHKAYGFKTATNYTGICITYHCMADLPLPKTMHTFA
ncbi:MAG: transposase [Desulfocapsaceae bacterium]|nr:transposase [Desulfocapsaceae bacterium]